MKKTENIKEKAHPRRKQDKGKSEDKSVRKKCKSVKNPCTGCKALCCQYVAIPIDKPTTRGDFEDIRWYIAHKKTWVFVESNDWYICFDNPCMFLSADYKCSIYDRRPRICRKYKTDNCELNGDGEPFDLQFKSPAEIEAYAEKYFSNRKARRQRGIPE